MKSCLYVWGMEKANNTHWKIIRLNDKTYRLINESLGLLSLGFFNQYLQDDIDFLDRLKTKESNEAMSNRYKIAKIFKQI